VSITVLSIGLLAGALLMSITFKYSVRSRYMAAAAQLASEKLEDLGRYPVQTVLGVVNVHPILFVPSGANYCGIAGVSCVGSITPALTCTGEGNCSFNSAASPLSITAGDEGAGGTVSDAAATVGYSDAVYFSWANGTMQETYEISTTATPNYATLTYSPNGQTPVPTNSANPPSTSGETFDRRWVIEQDQPTAGVRRVTVLVTLMDMTVQPPVTYQMSMVRQ
jgi:hypothetical protein